jgi:hypothetical protein
VGDGVLSAAWLHVGLTLLAFGAGLLTGWLWWGRQFVRARLTREEALSIMQGHLERELSDTDAKLARLLDPDAAPGARIQRALDDPGPDEEIARLLGDAAPGAHRPGGDG